MGNLLRHFNPPLRKRFFVNEGQSSGCEANDATMDKGVRFEKSEYLLGEVRQDEEKSISPCCK